MAFTFFQQETEDSHELVFRMTGKSWGSLGQDKQADGDLSLGVVWTAGPGMGVQVERQQVAVWWSPENGSRSRWWAWGGGAQLAGEALSPSRHGPLPRVGPRHSTAAFLL